MDRAFPQIKIQAQAQLQRQYKRSRFPSGGNHPPSPPHQQQSDAIIKHHSNASGGKKIYTLEIKPSPMKRRKTLSGPRIGMPPLENNSHFSTKQTSMNGINKITKNELSKNTKIKIFKLYFSGLKIDQNSTKN